MSRLLYPVLLLLMCAGVARAAEDDEPAAAAPAVETTVDAAPADVVPAYFTFTSENDFYFDSDDGYTGGIQLAWTFGPFDQFGGKNTSELTKKLAPRWIEGGEGYQRMVAHKFANVMTTPDDIELKIPEVDDIPYSGVSYWRTDWMRFNTTQADRVWGSIGVVGEISGAQWAQESLHELIGATHPEGWDAQVENGVVAEVGAVRNWRLFASGADDGGTDIVGITSANLGNMTTRADGGLLFRAGNNLLRHFPTATVLPGREVNAVAGANTNSAYGFLGVMYRYEAWNISLDGDTPDWYQSNVEREPNQLFASVGAAGNIGNIGLQMTFATSTDRVKHADNPPQWFGSASITWRYR